MSKITFGIFADFHYKKGMYAASVDDMQAIFSRFSSAGVDFAVHCGDMCNDYLGSPELIKASLDNPYGISLYGVYGNHELESKGNSMEVVTPLLTNDKSVIWGTPDGKADPNIGYYYFDKGDFRFIMLDTNYSFNPETAEWEHNATASWGPRSGNLHINNLTDPQRNWLKDRLFSAADEGKRCIIVSHDSFSERLLSHTSDTDQVRDIIRQANARRKGTVIMAINGHIHTNTIFMDEDLLFFDVNTTRNALWKPRAEPHYTDAHGEEISCFDAEGNLTGKKFVPYSSLWMSANTWYTKEPLSAIVTVTDKGEITIEGIKSTWACDLTPPGDYPACVAPEISSYNK